MTKSETVLFRSFGFGFDSGFWFRHSGFSLPNRLASAFDMTQGTFRPSSGDVSNSKPSPKPTAPSGRVDELSVAVPAGRRRTASAPTAPAKHPDPQLCWALIPVELRRRRKSSAWISAAVNWTSGAKSVFAPEDECLFPRTDGIGFVAYAGDWSAMSSRSAMQRAHEVLDYVGLGEARYRKVEILFDGHEAGAETGPRHRARSKLLNP